MILLNLKIIISLCSNFMLHGVGKALFPNDFFVNLVVFSLLGSYDSWEPVPEFFNLG